MHPLRRPPAPSRRLSSRPARPPRRAGRRGTSRCSGCARRASGGQDAPRAGDGPADGPEHHPAPLAGRALSEPCPSPAQRRARSTLLAAFEPSLRERWNAGEQNGQQLLRAIQERGYRGSQATLYGLLGRWRIGPRHSGPSAPQQTPAPSLPPPLRIAPREVSWLLLPPTEDLNPLETAYVSDLLRRDAVVATTQDAVLTFFALLHDRRGDQLDAWLEQADASGVRELAAFAEGIRRDERAIRAAFDLPWSQGQTEGQVNRLKLLKRQMYGRAKLDLLRRRVLGPPAA